MSVEDLTIYIKGDQNVEVQDRNVTLGDIVTMECSDTRVTEKLSSLKMIRIPDGKKHRYVVSILKLIEKMHEVYPNITVQNLGPADIIVTYEPVGKKSRLVDWTKTILVVLITFFGAAYSIMAFNNDVDTPKLFGQIYEQIMGVKKSGFTILEFTYSIGVVIGILVFFNHFGNKRFSVDPTPMEVEMRLYENDIQTTLIENYSRKEQELDVGKGSASGGNWS